MRRILAVLLLTSCSIVAAASTRYEWAGPFSPDEQAMLTEWIARTSAGLVSLTGPLPFEIHVRFHRSHNPREPVPWANTFRSGEQGVSFHVNPSFSMDRFIADWTAPHELSHLVFPYLGRRHAWVAEGFASYMQYQVMHRMGVAGWEEIIARYREKMSRAKQRYELDQLAFADAAHALRAARRYPTMYWGGAVLFLRADVRLRRESGRTLAQVLAEYIACCRMRDEDVAGLMRTLDVISATEVFADELRRFTEKAGFPDYESALDLLGRLGANGVAPGEPKAPRSATTTSAAGSS